jgi:hypothetical protein
LRLATAEAERETETTRLARLGRAAQLRAAADAAVAKKPQASDQVAQQQAAKTERKIDEAAAAAQQAEIDRLKEKADGQLKAAKELEAKLLAEKPAESGGIAPCLGQQAAVAEAKASMEVKAKSKTETIKANGNGNENGNGNGKTAEGGNGQENGQQEGRRDSNKCTRGQIEEVRRLVGVLKISTDKLAEILARANAKKVGDLTREACHVLIEKMLTKEKALQEQSGNLAGGRT